MGHADDGKGNGSAAGGGVPVTYAYQARDDEGRALQGCVEAFSAKEAARELQDKGLFIIRLRQRQPDRAAIYKSFFFRWQHKQYVVFFCRQLAALLSAHIPVADSLSFLARQEKDAAGRRILQEMADDLQHGMGLADSMGQRPEVFSCLVVQMVRSGEVSGRLETVLDRLSSYLESSWKARADFLTALLYPMLLGMAACMAAAFLLAFVLPSFAGLFASLRVPLPWPTRFLLSVSSFLHAYGWAVLAGSILCILLCGWWGRGKRQRYFLDGVLLRIPLLGPLLRDLACMHIMGTLAVLYESGMMMDQCLGVALLVTQNSCLKEALRKAQREVEGGGGLREGLAEHERYFPPLVLEFVAVGEETGELEMMLTKAVECCRFAAEERVKRLQALAEPCMILLLGMVVGGIVLSVALPMLEAVSSVR
jgi:type IV pilus assembly protein PilC